MKKKILHINIYRCRSFKYIQFFSKICKTAHNKIFAKNKYFCYKLKMYIILLPETSFGSTHNKIYLV